VSDKLSEKPYSSWSPFFSRSIPYPSKVQIVEFLFNNLELFLFRCRFRLSGRSLLSRGFGLLLLFFCGLLFGFFLWFSFTFLEGLNLCRLFGLLGESLFLFERLFFFLLLGLLWLSLLRLFFLARECLHLDLCLSPVPFFRRPTNLSLGLRNHP